jgi:hypothetical protein
MKKFIVTILVMVGLLMQSFAPSSDSIKNQEEKTIKIQLDNNLKLYQDAKTATMEEALNRVSNGYTTDVESRAILYQKLSSLVEMHLTEDKTFNLNYILNIMDIKTQVLINMLKENIVKQKKYYTALWGLLGIVIGFLILAIVRNWGGQWIFVLFSISLLTINIVLLPYLIGNIELQIIKELLNLSG